MAKDKEQDIKISFIGNNTQGVTGSMTLLEFQDYKILVDCGMVQTNRFKEDMKTNSRKFKFKVKELDYIFITHNHLDHSGLLPRLYSQGCTATTIVSEATQLLIKPALLDSARINATDIRRYNDKYKTKLKTLYDECDVDNAIEHMKGFEFNKEYFLNDDISFTLLQANHILGAYQLLLKVKKNDYVTKTILFTGDIGVTRQNDLLEPMDYCNKVDIVIGESTYGNEFQDKGKKYSRSRDKDMEFLKTIIDNTLDNNGKALIPVFALQRLQEIMICLYRLYKDDKSFDKYIYIDTPLGITYCELFKKILQGEKLALWEDILKWDRIKYVKSSEDSKALVDRKEANCILSCSGMLENGRIRFHLKNIITDSNSSITFVGFSPEGTLAGKLKDYKQKTVMFNQKQIKKKCQIHELKSFSAHGGQNDLCDYYSSIKTQAIYLVHGNKEAKMNLKKQLEDKGVESKIKIPEFESVIKL